MELPPHHFSRLLYPNPVCLLTTYDPATRERNVQLIVPADIKPHKLMSFQQVMTITWLTPINNEVNGIAFSFVVFA